VTPVTGTSLQPSAPDAVLPLTLGGQPCSNSTLISLCAICSGLLAETLNPDVMYLALARAKTDALVAGVDPLEFKRVKDLILKDWAVKRARNPMSGLF